MSVSKLNVLLSSKSSRSQHHPITRPLDCVLEYLDWYSRIMHLVVQPLESRSSTYSIAREDFDDDIHRHNVDAISISTDIVQMGQEEGESLGLEHLYDVIYHMI